MNRLKYVFGRKKPSCYGAEDRRYLLYVIGSLEVGGAERHVVEVALALKQRGWIPEFFVLTSGGPLTGKLQNAGIPIFGPRQPGWLIRLTSQRIQSWLRIALALPGLIWYMVVRKPAIVHFFLPAAYILGGIAALLTATRPRIMSRRSLNHYQQKYPIYRRLERLLHLRMDKLCGNSRAVVQQLECEGVRPDQVNLIYNGVDLIPFNKQFDRESLRDSLGVGRSTLLITVVANLIPYKGHSDLLNGMAHVSQRLSIPWCLLCIGRNDGIGDSLRDLARKLNLNSCVIWTGVRSDVPALLSASDIAVLPSHEEGFSNSILECMAAGLPMVVTDVGGNAEAVLDGDTGYVVPPRDPIALGEAILKLALDLNRCEMGSRGRERAEKNFSMASCLDGYEALYNEQLTIKIGKDKNATYLSD